MVSHPTLFCDTISAAPHRFFRGFLLTEKREKRSILSLARSRGSLYVGTHGLLYGLKLTINFWKSAQTNKLVSYLQTNN